VQEPLLARRVQPCGLCLKGVQQQQRYSDNSTPRPADAFLHVSYVSHACSRFSRVLLTALCRAVLCCVVLRSAGKVALSMYKQAEGIEAYVYEDKIEDADAGGQLCVLL
jgi:hypothetical protein